MFSSPGCSVSTSPDFNFINNGRGPVIASTVKLFDRSINKLPNLKSSSKFCLSASVPKALFF